VIQAIRLLTTTLLALSTTGLPLLAQTKGIVTFGGLKNLELIQNYYDGGTGSLGSGPGKNFGLQFTSNAQAIVSAAKGGSGNFINNPGGYPVMFFQTGNGVTINATNLISTGLWFSYSALQPGAVTVFDGPNGTGNVLANVTLAPNNSGCTTYKLCVWSPVGIPLSAVAGSIRFSGNANFLAIGSLHLGVAIPTSIHLVSSQNPSVLGAPVTFTATVSATGTAPIGTVTFRASNKVVGVVNVVGGAASLTISTLKVGNTQITSKFQGTGFGSISTGLVQTVNAE